MAAGDEVVTLCGSTRFPEAFIKATRDLTLQGKIVISVGLFGHQEGIDMGGPVKAMLDELHLRKIDISDSIFVLNDKSPWCDQCGKFRSDCHGCGYGFRGTFKPYIGESTRREIEYARSKGKRIDYLNPPEE